MRNNLPSLKSRNKNCELPCQESKYSLPAINACHLANGRSKDGIAYRRTISFVNLSYIQVNKQ